MSDDIILPQAPLRRPDRGCQPTGHGGQQPRGDGARRLAVRVDAAWADRGRCGRRWLNVPGAATWDGIWRDERRGAHETFRHDAQPRNMPDIGVKATSQTNRPVGRELHEALGRGQRGRRQAGAEGHRGAPSAREMVSLGWYTRSPSFCRRRCCQRCRWGSAPSGVAPSVFLGPPGMISSRKGTCREGTETATAPAATPSRASGARTEQGDQEGTITVFIRCTTCRWSRELRTEHQGA